MDEVVCLESQLTARQQVVGGGATFSSKHRGTVSITTWTAAFGIDRGSLELIQP